MLGWQVHKIDGKFRGILGSVMRTSLWRYWLVVSDVPSQLCLLGFHPHPLRPWNMETHSRGNMETHPRGTHSRGNTPTWNKHTWKHGNTLTWNYAHMETQSHENTWRHRNMWKHTHMGTRSRGNTETHSWGNTLMWKHGNILTWEHVHVETRKHIHGETLSCGNMKTHTHGDMTWKHGNAHVKTWRHDMETHTWKHTHMGDIETLAWKCSLIMQSDLTWKHTWVTRKHSHGNTASLHRETWQWNTWRHGNTHWR